MKIIHDHAFTDALEDALDKFHVRWVHLVIVLRLFVFEDEIQRDLVGLVHDGAVARDHFADVEVEAAGNGFQILVGAGNQFIGGGGIGRIGPENDNVLEHES